MDEKRLIEKLRAIEALFAGATTPGERVAADRARQRIRERLEAWEREDPPVEYRFTMADMWSRKVFVALLRRYGIRPYRYRRQRYTTVMARVSQRFVDETLWPEFQEISSSLRAYLGEVTERVVSQVIHTDSSEAEVVAEPKQLTGRVVEVEHTDASATAEAPKAPQAPAPPRADAAVPDRPAEDVPAASTTAPERNDAAKRKKKRRRWR